MLILIVPLFTICNNFDIDPNVDLIGKWNLISSSVNFYNPNNGELDSTNSDFFEETTYEFQADGRFQRYFNERCYFPWDTNPPTYWERKGKYVLWDYDPNLLTNIDDFSSYNHGIEILSISQDSLFLREWGNTPDNIMVDVFTKFGRSYYRYPSEDVNTKTACDSLNYVFEFFVVNQSTSTTQFDLRTVKLDYTNSVCYPDENVEHESVVLEPNMTYGRNDWKAIELYFYWETSEYTILKCGDVPNQSIEVTITTDYRVTINN